MISKLYTFDFFFTLKIETYQNMLGRIIFVIKFVSLKLINFFLTKKPKMNDLKKKNPHSIILTCFHFISHSPRLLLLVIIFKTRSP